MEFATDWPQLNQNEQGVIANFMISLAKGEPLKGKNKPSWVTDDFEKLSGTDAYEQENYWHYHCGPTWYSATFKGQTVDLKFNPGGMHSEECIHYYKKSDDHIVIVGYSKKHIPFLKPDNPDNPFFSED